MGAGWASACAGGARQGTAAAPDGRHRYFGLLSARFGRVVGVDISQELLDRATRFVIYSGAGRSRQRRLKNVEVAQADLRRGLPPNLPPADVGLCQNVLLLPDAAAQEAMLSTVRGGIRSKGALVLLVPSLESAIHVGQCLPQAMADNLDAFEGHSLLHGAPPGTSNRRARVSDPRPRRRTDSA